MIVAIGKNSFLARAVRDKNPQGWQFLSHTEALANAAWAKTARVIINFAFSPSLKKDGYNKTGDIDLKLAHLIRPFSAHYIMLSSRLVYGQGENLLGLTEDRAPNPSTPYAQAKLAIEKNLYDLLGHRLTILRLANIFGDESGRDSFFGMALESLLQKKQITFDMSPETIRDFMAVRHFTDAVIKIAVAPRPGIYNLGSGFGTPCGQVAEWLIEAYGGGALAVTNDAIHDQFWLNMEKTQEIYGIPALTTGTLRDDCMACGFSLRDKIASA